MANEVFIIKKGDDMYDIFVGLWKLLNAYAVKIPAGKDREAWNIFNDFRSRLPEINTYYDALDLAKEFCKKIGCKLIKET